MIGGGSVGDGWEHLLPVGGMILFAAANDFVFIALFPYFWEGFPLTWLGRDSPSRLCVMLRGVVPDPLVGPCQL
jgi:hypothetical protein